MAIVSASSSGSFGGGVSMGSTAVALPCGISFKIPYPPKISVILKRFKIKIPGIPPLPRLNLSINCDLSKPINITAGLEWGGGRLPNVTPTTPDEDGQTAPLAISTT